MNSKRFMILFCLSFFSIIATICLFCAPIVIGLVGVFLPALGYFPALGSYETSLAIITGFLTSPRAWQGIWLALSTGICATLFSVLFVFAIMACGAQAGIGSWLLRWHRRLMGPLIALPHSTIAIALLFLLAPSGWLVRLISPELTGWVRPPAFGIVPDQTGVMLVIGLMMKEIPFLLFIALAQSQHLPLARLQQLGASFGYRPVVIWAYVIWPQLYPKMRLPLMAVLAFSLSVVDMGLILGPTLPPTLSVLVLFGFQDPDLTARLAACAGAVVQIVVILLGIGIWLLLERLVAKVRQLCLAYGRRLSVLPLFVSAGFLVITGFFGLLLLGLGAIGLWAFANRWAFSDKIPQVFGLRYWQSEAAFGSILFDTLIIALGATLISLMLSAFWLEHVTGKKRLIQLITILLFVPLFVPQISLLFGLQVALSYAYLDGVMATVIFVHMLYILPYVWLVLAPAYEGHDRRYVQMAQSMGYGRWRYFWAVRLGMLGHSFGSAFIIGVAVSIALYLPSLFAGAGRVTTITMEAVTLAASGARGPSAQAAFIQMAVPVIAFVFIRALLTLRYRRHSAMQAHHTA